MSEINIQVFQDTLQKINTVPKFQELTNRSIAGTRIYPENFKSAKTPQYSRSAMYTRNDLTLRAAKRLYSTGKYKKIAVLNFASPVNPGGGVVSGANAQEEYLCRATTLYPCLVSQQASAYYMFNRQANNSVGTDKVIYSPNILVLKEDIGFSPSQSRATYTQEFTRNQFMIDVLTCAAPYNVNLQGKIAPEQLAEIFYKRIKNVLEVAIENGAEAIILGAWGCGAYGNPPSIVADAFHKVFSEPRYNTAFVDVCFAVLRTGANCPNLQNFSRNFPLANFR